MMITLSVMGDLITGSVNGEQFSVTFDEVKYAQMEALAEKADNAGTVEELQEIVNQFKPLTQESYKDLVEHKTPFIVVNKHTNKFYLKFNNKVSNKPMPQVLVDKIVKLVEKHISIDPIIKCWARYIREIPGRPKFTEQAAAMFALYIGAPYVNLKKQQELMDKEGLSLKMATEMATTPQVAITREGLLMCYKVSTEILKKYELTPDEEVIQKSRYEMTIDPDSGMITYKTPEVAEDRLFEPRIMGQGGDAFKCVGPDYNKLGHFIKVGCTVFLESWDQVSRPGCKGLHCGGLNYISGYQTDGTVTHNIIVDPSDIHSIQGVGTGNDGAMTVRRYFVHSTFGAVNKNIYHSSEYAKMTDDEYAGLIQKVVEETAMKQEELNDLLEGQKALASLKTGPQTGTADVFSGGGPVTSSGAKLNIEG